MPHWRAWYVMAAMWAARDAIAIMCVAVVMLMRGLAGLRYRADSHRQSENQEPDLCDFRQHVFELRYSILISKMRRGHHAKGNRFL